MSRTKILRYIYIYLLLFQIRHFLFEVLPSITVCNAYLLNCSCIHPVSPSRRDYST